MGALVERAKDLAYRAHAGQVDKAGRPYIEHVARVAASVAGDQNAEAVAWLHDVLEDCIDSDEEDFFKAIHIEFPALVSDTCRALIRPRSPYEQDDYYAGIRERPLALRVKLADIADNADESRLALLDEKTAKRLRRKYQQAIEALTTDRRMDGGDRV